MAISPACPARGPPATTELADRVAAVGAVAVREAGIGDTEARTDGLPANHTGRLGDERRKEAQQDAAAAEVLRERASQGVKARAIHRTHSRA